MFALATLPTVSGATEDRAVEQMVTVRSDSIVTIGDKAIINNPRIMVGSDLSNFRGADSDINFILLNHMHDPSYFGTGICRLFGFEAGYVTDTAKRIHTEPLLVEVDSFGRFVKLASLGVQV